MFNLFANCVIIDKNTGKKCTTKCKIRANPAIGTSFIAGKRNYEEWDKFRDTVDGKLQQADPVDVQYVGSDEEIKHCLFTRRCKILEPKLKDVDATYFCGDYAQKFREVSDDMRFNEKIKLCIEKNIEHIGKDLYKYDGKIYKHNTKL